MRPELLSKNLIGRTWAALFPLVKSYRLHPFEDYQRDMNFGMYRVEHWQHDTASQVRIYAVMSDASLNEESLLVYREDAWIGGYESHNDGTIQGYQHDGPWVADLEQYRAVFNAEVDAHIGKVRLAELRRRSLEDQDDAAKLDRFAKAFT